MTDAHLTVERTDGGVYAIWKGVAGQLLALVERAAGHGGKGMNALASTCYDSRDWALTRVVLHEAAHAEIAEGFGVPARIVIELGARFGNGHCALDAAVLTKSPHVRRLIGLAGPVAAQIAEFGACANARWISRYIAWPGAASPTDLSMAAGFCDADVAHCNDLVRRKWPAIAATARRVLHEQLQVNGQRGLK